MNESDTSEGTTVKHARRLQDLQVDTMLDVIALRDRCVAAETERDRLRDEVVWLRAQLERVATAGMPTEGHDSE